MVVEFFQSLLSSRRSQKKEEILGPILRMAQLNTNLESGFMNATGVGKSSNLRSSVVHEASVSINNFPFPNSAYLPGNAINNMEPCISLPPSYIQYSSNKPMNASSADKPVSPSDQGQPGTKRQQRENSTASSSLYRPESETCLESLPVRVKKERGTPIQMLKKSRIEVNLENIPHHLSFQELLFKGLQVLDPQHKEMSNQQREQNQQHQLILPSVPHLKGVQKQVPKQHMRNMLQDLGDNVSFGPVLDSHLCSRRLMQYLYHLRNRPHVNSIVYWKKFVSEYYAPDSKKRWCFSTYSDDKRHATGVFYPKPVEPWCCDICHSRSGKGLETTFEALPRVFKTKFDSGILDEILFLDLPRGYFKIPSGLWVLEYRKAIQESIYENFRVVHEGKLQIIFRWDLKILSWEFCVQNHEEYLLRSLLTPQVDQLARSAHKYQNDIQNGVSTTTSASSENFHANCDWFVVGGHQLARSMDLSVVNGLGYPKTLTRFLQIAEVLNCMTDLVAFSIETKMGPIESLNNYVQSCKTMDRLEKQGMELFAGPQNQQISHEHHANEYGCRMTDNELVSGPAKWTLDLADFNRQVFRRNTSITSMRRKGLDSHFADPSIRSIRYDSQPLASMRRKGLDSHFPDPSIKSTCYDSQPLASMRRKGLDSHFPDHSIKSTCYDSQPLASMRRKGLDSHFPDHSIKSTCYDSQPLASMRRKGLDSHFTDPSIRSTFYDSQPLMTRLHADLPPCNLPRSPSGLGKYYHQHLIDKMLQEMVTANRGKSSQYANEKINDEAACRSWPSDKHENSRLPSIEISDVASAQTDLANASRIKTIPHDSLQIVSGGIIVKTELRSPV